MDEWSGLTKVVVVVENKWCQSFLEINHHFLNSASSTLVA
jgi:hypothetical protein